MSADSLFLGIDVGTSGCRAIAIDRAGDLHGAATTPLPAPAEHGRGREQEPERWWQALRTVVAEIAAQLPCARIEAIAVDGTSATLLLTDATGRPLGPALMYHDARAVAQAQRIAAVAPAESGAHGATASLAKLLWLNAQGRTQGARHALHQAEWLAGRLSGRFGVGDENNCLKLGYDVIQRRWPAWLAQLPIDSSLLPEVVAPGTTIGTVTEALCAEFGFSPRTRVVAGTTDSVAGFLATGAAQVGEAVTSLGSTMVLKIIAAQPLFAPPFGVYSHRLGDTWLAGGASNSGGAVLLQHFTAQELQAMTPRLRPEQATGLDYYPLPAVGERFPDCDPQRAPRLTPRPDDPLRFFQGLLEGMTRIELAGYQRLAALGAPYPVSVRTIGGGARNAAWTTMRHGALHTTMTTPRHTEAAYGAALLAAGRLPLSTPGRHAI